MKYTKRALSFSVLSLLLCVSLLVGSTLAWFTDSVTSGNHVIQSGNLDVGLMWSTDLNGTWIDAEDKTSEKIFGEALWEPGYTQVRYFKIQNRGDLAFQYALNIVPNGNVSILGDVIDVYYVDSPAKNIEVREDLAAMDAVGTLAQVIDGAVPAQGVLLPESETATGELVVAVALKMRESAGNEYQNRSLCEGGFTVELVATQYEYESDSFGSDYDAEATFPFPDNKLDETATAEISVVDGKVASEVILTNGTVSAVVPAGVLVNSDTQSLTLTVKDKTQSDSNVTLDKNDQLRALDVHIEGIAEGNTVPMTITLREVAPVGLNMGNYTLYHSGVEMTYVALDDSFTAADQFKYDPATGDILLYMKNFSEVAVVADTENPWEGNRDYSWYNADATELTIANADQLAAFGAIVGGMDGQTQDSFSGKTVKLISDVNLGDKESENNPDIIFYPIGYYNTDGTYKKTNTAISSGFYAFQGTFDGNGHTIKNFYQNTWEMKGDHNWYDATLQYYRDGMGLFGKVYGGTVKNLTIDNFSSDGEITTTGCVAAYADCGATFENIAITKCNPRVYNIGNGGIVGCVGWYTKAETEKKVTFTNITVDNTNKISALWGSYDVACGGLVGQYYPTSGQSVENEGIHFENCHVAAQIDVYNDVCANYQYYAYRYAGMMIGSIRENVTGEDGHVYPKMDGITASGCTVHFGTWNDYYYCELVDNTTASYTHDYQMSRLVEIKAIDGTTITYLDGTTGTVPASGRANYVIVDYTKGHGTENATCYHFKDGAVWNHEDGGYHDGTDGGKIIDENGDGNPDLREDKQHIYLEFNNLFTGYGWGVTSKGLTDFEGVENLDITQGDHEDSVEKFEGKVNELANNKTYNLGDIFTFVDNGVELVPGALTVTVTNLDENNPVSAKIEYDRENWENGTITLTGTGEVTITIQDYYFCTPTTIEVTVTDRQPEEKFDVVMNNGDFLHRVGNQNAVSLGSLFAAKEGATINSSAVSIEIEPIAGNAAGDFTANETWTNGTIQFSGTGVVKVTITDNDYCIPTVLDLEVVDAVNATSATSATANNVVLLNNCGFSSLEVSGGYALYGNGFTMTCASDSVASDMGYAFVTLSDGTLDNVQIICPNFDYAALYKSNLTSSDNRSETDANGKTRYYNAKSGVMASGNSQILNSRISGARAAVNVTGGNVVIDNSRIELGAVASILVGAANSVTLRDVTLVQKPTASTHDSSKSLMGFSVLIMCNAGGTSAPITLEGTLVQNAWVDENDKQYVPDDAQSIIDTVMEKAEYLHDINGDGTNESLNLGIAYMPADGEYAVETPAIEDNRTNKADIPYESVAVKYSLMTTCVYSYKNSNGTADSFKTESIYVPNKYSDIITVTYSDTADGLTTGKSYGTDGWVYELNVDLDKLSGYELDFSKLSMTVNGVATTDFKVNGSDKPTSPVAVAAGGTTYTLTATVDGKEYTATYKVTGTETSKESPSLVASDYEPGLCVASSYGGTWHGAAPALEGIQIKYWSVAEKQYKTITLSDYTPTTAGKQNGTNTTWTYSPDNGDFTITLTGGQVHSSNNVYAMPVVCDGKLYFVAASSNGLVNTGNSARTISVSYSFKDNNNGDVLTFSHTWSVAENKNAQYKYSDFCNGTLTKLEDESCLAEGTLITMADGTKKAVEDLRKGNSVMAFDHLTGELTTSDVIIVVKTQSDYYENTFVFDDGTKLVTINEHGIFDLNLNKYANISHLNYAEYIGHTFVSVDSSGKLGTKKLVDVRSEFKTGYKYDIVTEQTLNYVAEDTLSVTHVLVDIINSFEYGSDLMFDLDKMQNDIEKYGLYEYDEWEEYCDISVFDEYNIPVMKVGVSKGLYAKEYIISLINTYVLDDSVQIID